ncbi:MAG: hypothetical protein GKS06_15300 [Acidobacteria bacterium]|nr:hypothetical protein [Acidobacteriota bacterium]
MKPTQTNNRVPAAWFAVALAQQTALWLLLPGPALVVAAGQAWLGALLLIGGLAVVYRARRHRELVNVEVHRWTDCPANFAMLVALVGSALWFGTWLCLLPVAGFVSVVGAQFVVSDEQSLIAGPRAAPSR